MNSLLELTKSRQIIVSTVVKKGSENFTIATYNILADGHAQRDYKNSSFITAEDLKEATRLKKIVAELKLLDADIVCLQEVGTTYFPTLLNDMKQLGYEGKYISRQGELSFEGEASFYKTNKFQLIESFEVILSDCIRGYINGLPDVEDAIKDKLISSLDSYTVSLIFHLRSVGGIFDVVVGNVHIGYEKLVRPDKQCVQIHMILKKLVNVLTQPNANKNTCSVICGDFNSWPNSAPHLLMKTGSLSDQHIASFKSISAGDGLEDKSIVERLPELFQSPIGYFYKSAYEEVLGSDQASTRYNFDNSVRPVDFIFYDGDRISPTFVTKCLDQKLLEGGAPNQVLPSDHLSLKAEFTFKLVAAGLD